MLDLVNSQNKLKIPFWKIIEAIEETSEGIPSDS